MLDRAGDSVRVDAIGMIRNQTPSLHYSRVKADCESQGHNPSFDSPLIQLVIFTVQQISTPMAN